MTGRWLCGALIAIGWAAVACGTGGKRLRLARAGSVLMLIGTVGALVLAEG